jgi:hypothetical protein
VNFRQTARFPRATIAIERSESMIDRLHRVLTVGFWMLAAAAAAGDEAGRPDDQPPTPEQVAFFEKSIRPVLAGKCYSCHSAEAKTPKGGLRLDTREGLRAGGDSGPALVPGEPAESLLIEALHHEDKGLRMPPKEKLPEAVIADFEQWVKMGAPDPREGGTPVARPEIDIEAGRRFWAFQTPQRQAPPPVRDESWPLSDVDRFLLARMEERGLRPVVDADRRALLRRVYFDLVGLPPSPEDVEAFAADPSPAAFEAVVDRLLASPQFGERWGRHWLDVARYAESSGRTVSFNYPYAWRYRDYVIAAFNADKPFDRFIREQVAGDLLPAADARQGAEQQIATGFLAVGAKTLSERDPLQFEMDVVDEQVDALSQAFLGLTVACARCHDHKFDPIPQRDYYALAGIFRSTETCFGTIRVIQSLHPSPPLEFPAESGLPPGLEPLAPEARRSLERQLAEVRERNDNRVKTGQRTTGADFNAMALLQHRLDTYAPDGSPKRRAMGVREKAEPVDSPLYIRGEVEKPGPVVPRGLVQVLDREPIAIPSGQSGRLELAEWLASPRNPLTARVFVNRVWLHLFGRGLVATPDNFGASGTPPSNPALLDHLAVSFMEDGWSVKRLVRRLVLSRAYGLGTDHDDADFKADPDNVLVWRMTPRRLDAEALRDALLAIGGELILTPSAVSPVTRAGEGGSAPLMKQAEQLDGGDFHRAVYLPVLRDGLLESLALFDFADPNQVVGERVATTVPAQGLFLLNSPFVQARAEAAADRLLAATSGDGDRLRRAYLTFLGRPPTPRELQAAEDFLARYPRTPGRTGDASGPGPKATWAALCQALFASADFLYRN